MCEEGLLKCIKQHHHQVLQQMSSIMTAPHENMGDVCKEAYYVEVLKAELSELEEEFQSISTELSNLKQKMAKTVLVLEQEHDFEDIRGVHYC